MTLRISLLPLALTALALPAQVLASPYGHRDTVVYAYPHAHTHAHAYHQQPTAYLVPSRPRMVVAQPRYQVMPTVQPGYAPHPGFPPPVVSHYGYPVTDYPSQPATTLAGGNGLAQQPRTCKPVVPLVGAALGGSFGAVMAHKSRDRRWALPMGAVVGGLLGGVASGC
jgi:hypothetical protein